MTYAEIIHYIELLGMAHRYIKGTYTGDYDRIEDLITGNGTFATPCIWIESPEMTPSGSLDSTTHRWNLAISILDKGNLQNDAINQAKYESTYRIALQLLYRIQKDVTEGLIKFSLIGRKLSAIDNYSANGMVGWRIELDIETYSSLPCYEPGVFDETVEVDKPLTFSIVPDSTPGQYVIDHFTELDGLGWNYTWKQQADAEDLTTIVDILTPIPAASFLYVEVTATLGQHTRVASCYIDILAGETDKKSVPYIFNPKAHD